MRRYCFLTILVSMVSLAAFPQVSSDNEDGVAKIETRFARQDFVTGQVLVKFSDANRVRLSRSRGMITTNLSRVSDVLSKYGVGDMEQLLPNENPKRQLRKSRAFNGETIQERDLSQLYLINLSDDYAEETSQMIEDLNTLDEVEFAEPNYRVYTLADVNIAADYSGNPMVSQQWYLDAYGVKELWNKPVINKARPVIAIIDTGVDITHPDLKDNIWTNEAELNGSADRDNDYNGFKNDVHGWDFINNTGKMRDNNKHGTHVAGIVAAANNGIGIVGANPRALIMPVTVMQSDGVGDVATIIKGIDYAVRNGATVINMSIGTYGNSNSLRQALERSYQSAVLVAAAGNDGRCIYASHFKKHEIPPMPCFPAAYPFVLGVQATTNASGSLATFSNYDDDSPLTSCESTVTDPDGYNYEIKAPGTKILSTIPGGKYDELQGTSMAAPLVAGAISALQMVKQYDTQETLWCDLLHSDDIVGAYNLSARTAELDIMRIEMKDRNVQSKEEKDGTYTTFYDVNVGETVNIYPVIRSTFGKATHIKMRLSAPSNVKVVVGEADFGYSLDALGKQVSKNPLTITIPKDMPNASTLDMKVTATCDESDKTFSYSFTMTVSNMYTLKGLLTEDMTLTPDHVYYVSGNFGVDEGATLTIKPGTRLEFAEDAGIYGFGKLIIKGTPEQPIVMTAYGEKPWAGVFSHKPDGKHESYKYNIYTNNDSTLFTLLPTDLTPNSISTLQRCFYYDPLDENPSKNFELKNYIEDWNSDFTGREDLLKDPNYLTSAMQKMMLDWKSYCNECSNKYSTKYSSSLNSAYIHAYFLNWEFYDNPTDTIYYCSIENYYGGGNTAPYYYDCMLYPGVDLSGYSSDPKICGERNVIDCLSEHVLLLSFDSRHTNIVNNNFSYPNDVGKFCESNFFNNVTIDENTQKKFLAIVSSRTPETIKLKNLPYMGTAREDLLRPFICENGNTVDTWWGETYATLDLSNIRKEPYHKAHGIIWKVLVNGKDAQDEQEELLPLGVGKHKFEVYFNRPMNKSVAPEISFGVISPYNQIPVSENGGWNNDGTIYTAYVTIDGKTQSDGMNRIYVRGAEDNEYFPCPYEVTRFNIMVQAAGSMASGFQADAGLGCVKLKWNNENNDFEDAMGFNVYRYAQGENNVNDTICINEDIIDITATSYVDDQVKPGTTYYYYYKVLSTALQEYDISNVVAATPLTATRGDANGNGNVDVTDVITTVNYVTGQQPKPFVFDAADMNSDKLIDILDVVGIIQGILNPSLLSTNSVNEEAAIYYVEDDTLYVDSPVDLSGIQVQLALPTDSEVAISDNLDGFEYASSWLSDNDYLFMAYSLSGKKLTAGKHALLYVGNGQVASIKLGDTNGKSIIAISNNGTTGVDRMGKDVMSVKGIYDLQGRKLSSFNSQPLKKGIYIIDGQKVVK